MNLRRNLSDLRHRPLLAALHAAARLTISIRAIAVFFAVTIILVIFLRVAIESMPNLWISLPGNCFDGQNSLACHRATHGFYDLHDALIIGRISQVFLVFRPVLLLLVGSVIPIIAYMLNLGDLAITRAFRPYIYLSIAHGLSLVIANVLIGEGMLAWIGAIYSLIRVVQLACIIPLMARQASQESLVRSRQRTYLFMIVLLTVLLVLWLLNFVFLASFLVLTTLGLLRLPLQLQISSLS